jgi:hypothetical protein
VRASLRAGLRQACGQPAGTCSSPRWCAHLPDKLDVPRVRAITRRTGPFTHSLDKLNGFEALVRPVKATQPGVAQLPDKLGHPGRAQFPDKPGHLRNYPTNRGTLNRGRKACRKLARRLAAGLRRPAAGLRQACRQARGRLAVSLQERPPG